MNETGRLDDAVPDTQGEGSWGGGSAREIISGWTVTMNGKRHHVGTSPEVEVLV